MKSSYDLDRPLSRDCIQLLNAAPPSLYFFLCTMHSGLFTFLSNLVGFFALSCSGPVARRELQITAH